MASTTTTLALIVEVVEGKDILPPKHGGSSASLYVAIEFGSQKRKTKTVKNSLEPNWSETLDFDVDQKDVPPLNLTLCDKGWTGGTPISKVSFKVPAKLLGGSADIVEEWHPLQPMKQGKSASGAVLIRMRATKKRTMKKNKSSAAVPDVSNADLFSLIRANDFDGVEEYLRSASSDDVNRVEEKTGNTPLHAACLDGKTLDERILIAILEYEGIKVDVPNADKNTPLHYFCAKWQNPEIRPLEIMLKKGAQVNFANSNAETAIFKAIWNESIRTLLMETLIEAGARVDLLNAFGESILHYAVRFGRSDLVNLILSAVPKVDIKGMENKTPYEIAVQYKHVTIAKHLKKVEELFLWLDKHDLGAFKGVFLKNEIYKNLLSDLTDSLLEKMQVSPADRAKILQATKHLDKEEADMTVDMEAGHSDELDDAKAEKIRGELAELTPAQADGKDWVIDGKDLEYLKRLGSGTSGDVYKGLYKGQHVAIKVLKEMTEEQERDEFKKEFKVMCAVHHPSIVQFFGASFKPKLCMVMEYCARGSMYHVLRDETLDINWDRALTLMVQTTEGIHALHTNTPQIMHRDLKSLNLLVTDDWQVKVADFGLSRFDTAEALETLKQMRGTFAYCAPESYNGAKYTLKSDIYSMGIIFWEVINRVLKGVYEQPYSEYKNIQFDFQIIIQASKDNLRPTLPATTPEALAKLVKACVHEDNESRPSGPEVLALLASAKTDYSSNKHQWDSLVRSVQVKGKK